MDARMGLPLDSNPNFSPVILPISPATIRGRLATSTMPGQVGAPTDSQFFFPAVSWNENDVAPDAAPRAVWPVCDCPTTRKLCGELAAGIQAGLPRGRHAVVALTSPEDGDGKTSVATVLAPELALRVSGGVLCVDADFRKADLTSHLTLPREGTARGGESLIYPTDRPRLSVLPRESDVNGFQSAWIDSLRERWPVVLLDMASMAHAETASLVRHCDAVCLVVRLGHTLQGAVLKSAKLIAACGDHLLGCIIIGRETGANA